MVTLLSYSTIKISVQGGSKENFSVSVHPKDGEYFIAEYPLQPMLVYGQCLQSAYRADAVLARCYSELCPQGESGSVPLSVIAEVISQEKFERARADGWPR